MEVVRRPETALVLTVIFGVGLAFYAYKINKKLEDKIVECEQRVKDLVGQVAKLAALEADTKKLTRSLKDLSKQVAIQKGKIQSCESSMDVQEQIINLLSAKLGADTTGITTGSAGPVSGAIRKDSRRKKGRRSSLSGSRSSSASSDDSGRVEISEESSSEKSRRRKKSRRS